MGAATRNSVAEGVAALEALTNPVADLGEQLLAAARGLASSRQLLAVLADAGVPADQRSALAQRAVGGQLGLQARTLLGTLCAGRWSEPSDLVAAVEELGFRALAASPTAGRLDAELFTVLRTVESDGRLELALGGSSSPLAARLALVDSLLVDAGPATRSIVRHLVELPRGRKPVEALREAQAIVAAAGDRLVALVEAAAPLDGSQVEALTRRLEAGYRRKILINQTVDPTLLGGVRVTVGDDVIDGTVRGRLDDLRQRLVG